MRENALLFSVIANRPFTVLALTMRSSILLTAGVVLDLFVVDFPLDSFSLLNDSRLQQPYDLQMIKLSIRTHDITIYHIPVIFGFLAVASAETVRASASSDAPDPTLVHY